MTDLLIKNATLVTVDQVLENKALLVKDGRIEKMGRPDEFNARGVEQFDAQGNYIASGFIDLHIHGIKQWVVDDGPEEVEQMSKTLCQYGVTGFLPTACPLPPGKDAQFIKQLATIKPSGAQILAFHTEGPFLTKTGALPPEALGKVDSARVRALIEAAAPYKLIFSISPDFEGITDLIRIMTQNGLPVFMTHTGACVKDTQTAIDAGATHATHFYDVFYSPPETDPGVRPCGAVEAILADERVSVDFILDGEHVDPVAVKMALKCKGPGKVCLITDANKGAGLPPGRYKTLGTEVEFKYPGAPARMTENSSCPGGLAGSGLTTDQAVRNAVKMLGVDLPLAVRMASANPARVLGLKAKGRIEKGFDADLVMLDRDLNVLKTWVAGRCCYSK